MADVDEALVEALKTAIYDALHAETMRSAPYDAAGVHASRDRVARAVLAHLGGQLTALGGEGEERVEWNVRLLSGGLFWIGPEIISEEMARAATNHEVASTRALVHRTVRTWTTPDGATGTLVGPWVEEAPRG